MQLTVSKMLYQRHDVGRAKALKRMEQIGNGDTNFDRAARLSEVPYFRASIGPEEIEAVIAVLRSGWLTTGSVAREFERRFAEYIGGAVEAVAVNSATAGLHLALEALGLGPKDEVILPTLTFTATAEVVRYLGATVVLGDVNRRSRNLELDEIKRLVTPRTKAIMPVHFGGLPCDMRAILDFARERGIAVVDDAAHALPATSGNCRVGAHGADATVFSFYANKTITTGEGGMLVTANQEIAKRARVMRLHGMNQDSFDRFTQRGVSWEYDVIAPGFKYNLTDIAAAIGIHQLAKADLLTQRRRRIAARYKELLLGAPIDVPPEAPAADSQSWHLFSILIKPSAPIGRDEFITRLNEMGIGTSVHYKPLHRMTYWREHCSVTQSSFPVAEDFFHRTVSLPIFPDMTDQDVEYVARAVRESLGC